MQAVTGNQCEAARRLGIPRPTLQQRLRSAQREGIFPAAFTPPAEDWEIPNALNDDPGELRITDALKILYLSDVHLPYHDKAALECAIRDGQAFGANAVLLNGDIMDCAAFSHHARTVRERMGWQADKRIGQAFFDALRKAFPSARIFYRPANHERRIPMWVAANAPELHGDPNIELPSMLNLAGYGVQWIEDGSRLSFGMLHVRHGDEWRIGAGVVNPAKIALERARQSVIIGHFHRKSDYAVRSIDGSITAAWSAGCLCTLRPKWLPENQWVHGHGLIETHVNGEFDVRMRTIIHGRAC